MKTSEKPIINILLDIHSLPLSFVLCLVHSFIHSFTHSLIHSPIHKSLIHEPLILHSPLPFLLCILHPPIFFFIFKLYSLIQIDPPLFAFLFLSSSLLVPSFSFMSCFRSKFQFPISEKLTSNENCITKSMSFPKKPIDNIFTSTPCS